MPDDGGGAAERLRELQRLRDEGLITEAEFEERRARILDETFGSGETRDASDSGAGSPGQPDTDPPRDERAPPSGPAEDRPKLDPPGERVVNPVRWPNWLRITAIVFSGVWIVTIPFMFWRASRYTWLPYLGVATAAILVLAIAAGGSGDESDQPAPAPAAQPAGSATPVLPEAAPTPEPTAAVATPEPSSGVPTTTLSPAPTGSPTAVTPAPSAAPETLEITLRDLHHIVWEDWLLGVRVHFVARVENTGTVPAEIRDIEYEMRDHGGALLESGGVPHSFPRKLAPGQVGVIGRTVTADAASVASDVQTIVLDFKARRVDAPDNLLDVRSVRFDGEDEFGNILASGTVLQRSEKVYDDVKIAVVLVDDSGRWVGYATADLPVGEVPPGELVRFVTDADLPAERLPPVASIEVIAFDR